MKPRSIASLAAGLCLLALAAAQIPRPRANPHPALPEIPPFSSRDRIALVCQAPEDMAPLAGVALLHRAHAAGADVRTFAPGVPFGDFSPTRLYQTAPFPDTPTGYHPDQWPLPPPENASPWLMLTLTPEETTAKNAAVLAAAHALRDSGTDDTPGTREAALLALARRAELYRPLPL